MADNFRLGSYGVPGGNATRTSNIGSLVANAVGRGSDPVPSFRFVVELDDRVVGAFTECKLPHVAWKPQKIYEGGLNTYTHQLPGQRKPNKLTLKRGVGVTMHLFDWYVESMKGRFRPHVVTVKLLDARRRPAMTWSIEDAYPMKWSGLKLKFGCSGTIPSGT